MELRKIKSEKEYDKALALLDEYFDAPVGTDESDMADVLALLIEDYEKHHFPIDAPDPIEAIKIRMKEQSLRQADIVREFGGKSRVSEMLNRKRKLTLEMIRYLSEKLNLSADILIREYQLQS